MILRIALLLAFLTHLAALSRNINNDNGHSHHPPHNMVLYGTNEIFASHIVYKSPHNYQVILKLDLDLKTKEVYLKSLSEHSNDQFILLLDSMDIKDIADVSFISGQILHEDPSGNRNVVLDHIVIDRKDYKVVFFNELPLSLEK